MTFSRRAGRGALLLAAGLSGVVSWGCARPGSPQGGLVPDIPPAVVSTRPDTFQVVEAFDRAVRLEFDVPMSERPTTGQLRDAVVVSPRTGSVSVRHRGDRYEVSMEGGFQEGQIYRITLLPVFQDRFQNRMEGPFDLFFSTGPDFEENLAAGFVVDRLTGNEVEGARVDAVPEDGGPHQSTVADENGIFAFPYLPSGEYLFVAYEDRNRNREPDFEEPQDSVRASVAPGDTLVLTDVALLLPDTTEAELLAAEAVDSTAVELEFDDHLDPEWPTDPVEARLSREDGEEAPRVLEVLHLHEWEVRERERAEREREEEPEPEEPDPDDPDAEPADPDDREPGEPQAPQAPPEPEDEEPEIRPGQSLVLILDGPLEPGSEYRVHVEGVENINGIPGGGGTATFMAPEPPEDPDPGRPGRDDGPS